MRFSDESKADFAERIMREKGFVKHARRVAVPPAHAGVRSTDVILAEQAARDEARFGREYKYGRPDWAVLGAVRV